MYRKNGGLAQLARAFAWHAKGHRFDSGNLHHPKACSPNKLFSFMPFLVYILYSSPLDEYYVGHSGDIDDRVFRHTNSGSRSTKKATDWKLMYTEVFQSKAAAYQREREIKKKKSRKYIEWLISGGNG